MKGIIILLKCWTCRHGTNQDVVNHHFQIRLPGEVLHYTQEEVASKFTMKIQNCVSEYA